MEIKIFIIIVIYNLEEKMKKFLIFIIVASVCVLSFASCSNSKKNEQDLSDGEEEEEYEEVVNEDPLALAKKFDEKDYYVEVRVDSKDIESFADTFEVRRKGINYIVAVASDNDEDFGMYIYCNNSTTAEKMVSDFEEYAEEELKEELKRVIIEREDKIVFIGSEDIWEAIR